MRAVDSDTAIGREGGPKRFETLYNLKAWQEVRRKTPKEPP
jgi:hypothetical protein